MLAPLHFHARQIVIEARDAPIPLFHREAAKAHFLREAHHLQRHAVAWRAYLIWRVYVSLAREWLCSQGYIKGPSIYSEDWSMQASLVIATKLGGSGEAGGQQILLALPPPSPHTLQREREILAALGGALPTHTPFDTGSTCGAFNCAILSIVELDVGLKHGAAEVAEAARAAASQRDPTTSSMLAILIVRSAP